MTRNELTLKIVEAKIATGQTWQSLADAIGQSLVWTTSALLGQNTMTPDEASVVADRLGLSADEARLLTVPALRGSLDPTLPTDPLVYRFYEIMQVYGTTLKAVIHEQFGDGIMSAIDFELDVEKVPDPKGDRVRVTMNGKFLPYKKF